MKEKHTKGMSLAELRQLKGQTDWDRLKHEGDFEGEEEFEIDWSRARVVEPHRKVMISVRLDEDVLSYLKDQGRGYQTRINNILRSYMEAKSR